MAPGEPRRQDYITVDSNARELESRFEAASARYRGTIRTFAYSCVNQLPGDISVEDIEQELLLKLWDCVVKYDPDRGASFNVLFQGVAKNTIISLVRHHSAQKRRAVICYLEQEEVAIAIDYLHREYSAEDHFMAQEHARDLLRAS